MVAASFPSLSQTLTIPSNFNPLRHSSPRSFSLQRSRSSKRTFVVRAVKLSDYKGKKYVILFFYPLDFTFVCPTEITAFSDRHGEFEKLNTEILSVSVDSVVSSFIVPFFMLMLLLEEGWKLRMEELRLRREAIEKDKELMALKKRVLCYLYSLIPLDFFRSWEEGRSLKQWIIFMLILIREEEDGLFYALDLGGTNFRVLRVQLKGEDGGGISHQEFAEVSIPPTLMVATSEELFGYIAEALAKFVSLLTFSVVGKREGVLNNGSSSC